MPILEYEPDIHPADLFDSPQLGEEASRRWWTFYLRARQEKQFMRRLRSLNISHYGPIVTKRSRSPSGRERVSHAPLFSGYVFMYGDDEHRRRALTTNCVSRCIEVPDGGELSHDLRNLRGLIAGRRCGDARSEARSRHAGAHSIRTLSRSGRNRHFAAGRFAACSWPCASCSKGHRSNSATTKSSGFDVADCLRRRFSAVLFRSFSVSLFAQSRTVYS